jgi:hypothetical protein
MVKEDPRKELLGVSLGSFWVEEANEVSNLDTDNNSRVLVYVRDDTVAQVLRENGPGGPKANKVRKVLVLTRPKPPLGSADNPEESFILGESVTVVNDTEATIKAKDFSFAKLSMADRKLLGF